MELLHSKLVTRRWPSKTVIEKRLRAFISQCRVSSQAVFNGSDSNGYGSEGIGGNYPIGNPLWEDTPLADESWKFPELCEPVGGVKNTAKTVAPSPKELLAAAVANETTNTGEIEVAPVTMDDVNAAGNHPSGENRGLHVQWVYDAREIVGPVKGGQNQKMGQHQRIGGGGGVSGTATSQTLTTQSTRPRPKSASSAPSSSSSKMVSNNSSSPSQMGSQMGTSGFNKMTVNSSNSQPMTSASTTVTGNEPIVTATP